MKVHELSRADARRVAVRAQRLTADRPTDLHETVHDLWLLLLDPTAAVAPSADLVLWSRLGSAYEPRDLADALDEQSILEYRGTLRVAADLALYRAEMAVWPGPDDRLKDWQRAHRQWVTDNEGCRQDILELLRSDGPLPLSELPDTCVRPWRSTGWNNNRNVTMLLSLMVQMGDVAAAGGTGRARLWDLAERVYPPGPPVPLAEAYRVRDARRLAALGIARPRGPEQPVEPVDVGPAGEPAVVDGVRGEWRVDPALLDAPFEGRAALLSPFDLLLHDRKRMADIFEFDYIIEMYKPAAKRRWGYYALPVLVGDRLVGKLDATSDVRAGVLRVHAVHEDEPWDPAVRVAVDRELDDLARWLELDLVRPR
ncbi:DNA glycosylase AlkZ-like family protein [Cellulomonas fengjieae]|uniref:Winged helix DNA-binding domain-containing protein n=1 Tax=Cellulomonas fengjieae TaxID=2819978 RepID=A0ABS3SBS1_9CELL|nr:crosslink repair DNA glycosylase YcaQ family protein [Cellulomonas fengjieae]MBO3083203.1 winged helix DNA-binding domain-containing protein [Cellulomonas fengjieae]MBO3102050.1 winged helix DNA-binding domain-containing protein [Cellulomonas fengjieae]QVI65440.1 winged helix DNA-binding domain-containing protein [Cellulomonas fengjieae]